MRYMIPLFYRITRQVSRFLVVQPRLFCSLNVAAVLQLSDIMKAKSCDGPQEMDIMEWMGRVALELIGQGGLGYSFNALEGTIKNDYAEAVREFTCATSPNFFSPKSGQAKWISLCPNARPTLARLQLPQQILPWATQVGPSWFRRWLAKTLPWEDLNRMVDMVDFMHETSTKILEEKKTALEKGDDAVMHQVAEGRDIMSVLRESFFHDDTCPDC